jgi:hypothetical protein
MRETVEGTTFDESRAVFVAHIDFEDCEGDCGWSGDIYVYDDISRWFLVGKGGEWTVFSKCVGKYDDREPGEAVLELSKDEVIYLLRGEASAASYDALQKYAKELDYDPDTDYDDEEPYVYVLE